MKKPTVECSSCNALIAVEPRHAGRIVKCASCGNRVSVPKELPVPEPREIVTPSTQPHKLRDRSPYKSLKITLAVLQWTIFIGCVIGVFVGVWFLKQDDLALGFGMIGVSALVAIFNMAFVDFVRVVIDIESNTRKIVDKI